jgi:hypothetical protein
MNPKTGAEVPGIGGKPGMRTFAGNSGVVTFWLPSGWTASRSVVSR